MFPDCGQGPQLRRRPAQGNGRLLTVALALGFGDFDVLRCGDQVRLSDQEKDELAILGYVRPSAIASVAELEAFLRRRVEEMAELERLGALTPEGILCARLLAGKLEALTTG